MKILRITNKTNYYKQNFYLFIFQCK